MQLQLPAAVMALIANSWDALRLRFVAAASHKDCFVKIVKIV